MQRHNDTSNTTRIDTIIGGRPSRRIPVQAAILVSAILLCGWSCATKKSSFRLACPSLDAGDYYFPKGILDPHRPKIDEMIRNWYSKHLRAMQEPSLSCGERTVEFTYRFLWLRTFHHPISVRIEKEGSSVTLSAVELDGAGGYAPGGIAKRVHRALSSAEQEKLLTKLNRIGFWEMRTNQNQFGPEGAQWVLEGAANGQYHLVDRWSPGFGAYHEVCLLFLELAGLAVPPANVY